MFFPLENKTSYEIEIKPDHNALGEFVYTSKHIIMRMQYMGSFCGL